MAEDGITKRRVKVSKNKKKFWNKYCDVKEVEDFLEEKRFEERIGWKPGKASEELFFHDHTSEIDKPVKDKKALTTLKCHQNLGVYSSVPPPVNVKVNRYSKKIKEVLSRKADKQLKKLVNQESKQKQVKKETENFKDPWAENEEIDDEIEDLIIYRDEITEKRTPNVPCHRFQKPSLLPAVEIPHAGASYNPVYEDHQDLLRKAVDVEEKHMKEELHLKRVLNDMFPTKAQAPTEKSILEEMSQGLFEDDDIEEQTENSNGFILRNPPVLAEDRLPKSRKRKRKELKEEARMRSVEKLNRQRLHEIYRIPSLKKEIKKDQEISKMRQDKNFKRKVDKLYNPATLSSYKYQPPDIEVNLTEEITGSLRTIKADGNILEDRYKSLQRRNLIEPRTLQRMKRKYKLKVQVKRSHRNIE